MKKLFVLSFALLLCGFSLAAAQKPDSVYLLGAIGTPIDAAAPDLNNDGNPDLVFISINGDSIITMLGNGTGTFTSRVASAAPAGATMVALDVADFNNDGNVDAVAASLSATNILVFSGNGAGALTYYASGSGSNAIDVVTGHFDPNSPLNLNVDIALLLWTASGVSDSVQYYFGNGTGFFPGTTKVPTGGKQPYFITKQTQPGTLPALDNIAVANFSSGNLGLIISNGNGTFQPTVTIPTRAANPGGIAWDFFDNDNLLDLAYNGYSNDSLFVQKGTGLTAYNAAVSYPLRANPFGMASGDFTGDGHIDLASVNLSNDSLSFYVNNGAGGFLPIINAPLGFSDRNITAADINNNGVPDLLVGASSGNFFGIFNLQSPSVTNSIISNQPPAGAAFTLPVMSARDSTNIASVKFVYRQMGKTAYDTLTMTPGAGTPTQRDYTGTLPAAAMTNRGLEYHIRTSDGFVTANIPYNRFIRLSTSISQNAPATLNRSYQLVSLPMRFSGTNGTPNIQIADDFSLTDSNVARLFWWDPVKADTITADTTSLKGYREFPFPGLTNFAFTPGRSMFLATVGSKVYDGVGLSTLPNLTLRLPTPFGDSVSVDYYVPLFPIDSGWNMIASPFPYTVYLDSVDVIVPDIDLNLHEVTDPVRDNRIGSGAANLRERTASGYIAPSPPLLKPWRGYFLKNNGPEQVLLLYPKLDGNFPATAPSVPKAYAAGLDWKIDIMAKSGEIETPPTTLGTSKAALREYDRLDWELPPAMSGDLRVVFQRGKEFGLAGDYLTDIRPTLTESEIWSFTVEPGGTRAIEMNFDGLADISDNYDVILTDKEGRAKQNLRLEPVYRFIASDNRHFELTVAPKTTGQTALLPTKYDLHQNFPNPFNPQTLIKYDLPEASNVRLEVFNILGQKVTTLVNQFEAAGPKSVVWDGTDGRGAKVASGIYFYKIAAGDFLATKKMTLVK